MVMIETIDRNARGMLRTKHWMAAWFLLVLLVFMSMPAVARIDEDNPILTRGYNPNGVFVLDGTYVMNVGEAQVNITNWGLIGSAFSWASSYSDAPSCQWPAGSGVEYLWEAGLWVGGVVLGERLVSMGGWQSEMYPLADDLNSTIYEAIETKVVRPNGFADSSGRREPMPDPNDDGDQWTDEEILNGEDDDGDGLVDEDFAQLGNQMFVCTVYDNTRLAQEDNPDHTPMNLEVIQRSFQWENDLVDDFVGFEFIINNIGVIDIENVYLGFKADSDIGPRSEPGIADDDLAGSFDGMVTASDGSYVPVSVGYMYDWSETIRVDGYFGVIFLGHDTDPSGKFAPKRVGLRTFQAFSGNQSFEQGGDPSNDNEAYQLLSADKADWDGNIQEGKEDDFRFLVSAGPFTTLPAGGSLQFQVAMVVGPGLGSDGATQGLLPNCAEAALTWYGIFVDKVTTVTPIETCSTPVPFNPGQLGRESMLCREDFDTGGSGINPWDTFLPDFGDTSCVDRDWLQAHAQRLGDCDKFSYTFEDGTTKICAMFNMDNCFECARQVGRICTGLGGEIASGLWQCNDPAATSFAGCTGVDNLEYQIHWLVGMAPPPPGLRLWSADSRTHVFWDDRSEIVPDIRLDKIDFESYRVWRADNWDRPFGSSLENGPESSLWHMIAEYDLVNYFINIREVANTFVLDTIPLGANTGLDVISYTPRCLDDPEFDGLAEDMQVVVDNDPEGNLISRPPLRLVSGEPDPDYVILIPWESYPAVLDTFFAVAYRAFDDSDPDNVIREKRSTHYYEYIDRDVHNGFIYFYSVTATDHALLPGNNDFGISEGFPVGPGLSGDPGSSFQSTVPGTKSQTAEEREEFGVNIYVFPNPATRDALEEFQELGPTGTDPTGVRINFTNLPAAHNDIQIFTVSGDLVQTINHDGTMGVGHASWNLMSRNDQEVVSGIYLYVVHSDDDRFEDFIGKFVVVR